MWGMAANPKRHWFQISLRSFFVAIALFALALSWWKHHRFCQQRTEMHSKIAKMLTAGDAPQSGFRVRMAQAYRRAEWLPWERLWIDDPC